MWEVRVKQCNPMGLQPDLYTRLGRSHHNRTTTKKEGKKRQIHYLNPQCFNHMHNSVQRGIGDEFTNFKQAYKKKQEQKL
jgi:hypothetical protein